MSRSASPRVLSWVCSQTGGGISGEEEVSLHWSFSPPTIWNSKAQNCSIKNFKCLVYVILPLQSRHRLNRPELQLPSLSSYCLSKGCPLVLLCTIQGAVQGQTQQPCSTPGLGIPLQGATSLTERRNPQIRVPRPKQPQTWHSSVPMLPAGSFLNRELDGLLPMGNI